MSQPLVSVIIPAWNGRDHLEACLAALQAQTYSPIEVIVVDNASKDGSAELVEALFPDVKLIRNRYNLGFAGGCNTGLKVAKGEILMLLNQDTIADANWVQALADALQDEKIGLVGSKIFYPDGVTIQHAGAWIKWPLGLTHHHTKESSDTLELVECVTGAAIAFRRVVMQQVGLLDEGFWPGYFEDMDYCYRVRAAGYEIGYVPNAIVCHKETTSISDKTQLSRYYQQGRLRFLLKHMPPERLLTEWVPAEKDYQKPAIFGLESLPLRLAYLEAISHAVPLLKKQWQADEQTINQVVKALQALHQSAWQHDWGRIKAVLGPVVPPSELTSSASETEHHHHQVAIKMPEVLIPSLKPMQFNSSLPLIGSLIARGRSLWYNVAARWGIQEFMVQQERINWTLMQGLNEAVSQTFEVVNQKFEAVSHQFAQISQQQQASHQQQRNIMHKQQRYIQALEQQISELATENEILARKISDLNNNGKLE